MVLKPPKSELLVLAEASVTRPALSQPHTLEWVSAPGCSPSGSSFFPLEEHQVLSSAPKCAPEGSSQPAQAGVRFPGGRLPGQPKALPRAWPPRCCSLSSQTWRGSSASGRALFLPFLEISIL